ncbi:hypothetical protein [Peribacillus huizhouensis]|uniref:Uncharacterized protein n=1 Tax=Peribacillus huizhouensis TaxID=1501239 RepID=A0ABR6CPF6_9BACI|nr:hypothetical protein [Peribacillus huizhouensis]MBA9026924.1 hypothetical protein [Peribacillus huizhouensis]
METKWIPSGLKVVSGTVLELVLRIISVTVAVFDCCTAAISLL